MEGLMKERVGYVVKRLQSVLRARMDEALGDCGLTMPQYAALSALERDPGISNAELARRSFVTPQTMIRIVANLETQGLVARKPHPHHGRVLQTVLTAKGHGLIARCHESALEVERRMTASLTEREHRKLLDLLGRCARSLE
jgi:DNA-binding MarR family transcriptional regulator